MQNPPQSARRLQALCLATGFLSGLPFALSSSTLQLWLQQRGANLTTIGAFSIAGLPYTLKFLWAGWLDVFCVPGGSPKHLRRDWMSFFSLSIALLFLVFSWTGWASPKTHFMLGIGLAFASASLDIVLNAYMTEQLQDRMTALGNSLQVYGYRTAMVVSGGLSLVVADYFGFEATYQIMMAFFIFTFWLVWKWYLPEPERPEIALKRSFGHALVHPWLDLGAQRGCLGLFGFVLFYKLGDAFASTLNTTYLREMGYSLKHIGSAMKIIGFTASLLGTSGGAWLLNKVPLGRALLWCGFFQSLTNLLYLSVMQAYRPSWPGYETWGLYLVLSIEHFAGAMGQVAMSFVIMQACRAPFVGAQFALLTAISSVGRVAAGPFAGAVASKSWAAYYGASLLLAVPGLLFAWAYARMKAPKLQTS